MSPGLRASETLTASIAHEVNQPLSGIVTNASTCLRMLASEPPFVMTTLRGRLYLRLQLATPDADDIAEALGLLETAASEAMRVGAKRPQVTGDWEAGAASTWQSVDPGRRRGAG